MRTDKEREASKRYRQNPKNKEKLRIYNTNYMRKKRGWPKMVKNEYSGLSPKDRLRAMRLTVLRHYGGNPPRCACCGEQTYQFLSIDHINNDGAEHRKNITKTGKGGNISFWLLKNGLPVGFQILCHNCNMAKSFYDGCPHKKTML